MDGLLKLSQAALRSPVTDIRKIEFYAADANTGTACVDNIRVYR